MTFTTRKTSASIPLTPLTATTLRVWLRQADARIKAWVKATGFTAAPGTASFLPGPSGTLSRVLFGVEAKAEDKDKAEPGGGLWDLAGLRGKLPDGRYYLDADLAPHAATQAALGWALAGYVFDRYKEVSTSKAELVWPDRVDRAEVKRLAAGTALTRDLINTPAGDLGPAELAAAAQALARQHKAKITTITGDDLLTQNYPSIHAVGRAAAQAPRLIDLVWGNRKHPRVTLVGKGVCFDSGGLDIKPASGMLTMKKDMGGAAQVLGIARMIMDAGLPIRLRVLVPAVENAISGNAFHPLDVLDTRKGLTVEVGNTDAEGRLILSDALSEAAREKPAMIIDFATLTGAARIALGTELPALFCNDETLAGDLMRGGEAVGDPYWRMPLWPPYRKHLRSNVADLSSTGTSPMGGAITAALFLEHFVEPDIPWAHIDLMAWNLSTQPGRPEGGEAMGSRAVYAMLKARFG